MSNTLKDRNLTLLTDFYELTMAGGYFENGLKDKTAYFDMFYRSNPDKSGYAIMAGVEQMIEYLINLKFTEDDIVFLRSKGLFSESFLDYLRNFKFECDVWAVPEGTPIFPGEPIVTVRGPLIQAQFVETMILLSVNHQSLIATKLTGCQELLQAELLWSSAQDALRVTTELFTVQERLTSAVAAVLLVLSANETSQCLRSVLWLTPGFSPLIQNTRPSRLMQDFIPTTALCL